MSSGNQIKKLRKMAGLTLLQLSERTGVDVGTISALENRGSRRSEFFGVIAAALGVTIEQLLGDGLDVDRYQSALNASEKLASYAITKKSDWPFRSIRKDEWEKLDTYRRDAAESFIRGMLVSADADQQANHEQLVQRQKL